MFEWAKFKRFDKVFIAGMFSLLCTGFGYLYIFNYKQILEIDMFKLIVLSFSLVLPIFVWYLGLITLITLDYFSDKNSEALYISVGFSFFITNTNYYLAILVKYLFNYRFVTRISVIIFIITFLILIARFTIGNRIVK